MSAPEPAAATETRPNGITEIDYCPDAGIAKIEELAAKLPANGFDLSINQSTQRKVMCVFEFEPGDPFKHVGTVVAIASAGTVLQTLCLNLRAERAARRELEDGTMQRAAKVECPCCEGTGKATGYVQYDGGKVTFHDAGDPCDDCGGSGSLYRIGGAS